MENKEKAQKIEADIYLKYSVDNTKDNRKKLDDLYSKFKKEYEEAFPEYKVLMTSVGTRAAKVEDLILLGDN
jgi:hypothetical protein